MAATTTFTSTDSGQSWTSGSTFTFPQTTSTSGYQYYTISYDETGAPVKSAEDLRKELKKAEKAERKTKALARKSKERKARALKNLERIAKGDNDAAFDAARYLLENTETPW